MWKSKPPSLPEPTPPTPPPVLGLGEKERQENGRISERTPTFRIAHGIIAQALREQAAQIRLTPQGDKTDVDYLVNGEWQTTMHIPHQNVPGLFATFKELAGLPDWKHRMALQGLIAVRRDSIDYDIIVFVTPTRQGEMILMRIDTPGADTGVSSENNIL